MERTLGPILLPEKACTNCNVSWTLTDSFFAKDAESPDGFKNQCKKCDQVKDECERYEEIQEQIGKLDRASVEILQSLSEKPATAVNLPHLATLLEDLITVWGGSMGFAQRCQAEYLAAKPGSMIRQRYNQMISKLVLESSSQGYVQVPLDKMSDEEIERAYMDRKESLKLRLIGSNGHNLQDTG
jgi:hypothetical protein